MPLTLVLGPANSAKAGEVLGAYAAAAPRGALLVVPTSEDAAHYDRELAAGGTLLGRSLTFGALIAEIARRAGHAPPRLSALQRERLLRRTIARLPWRAVADSARAPGFATAAGRLIAELEASRIGAPRFSAALRAWAGPDPGRTAYAQDIAALPLAYASERARTGRLDTERFTTEALDALRAAPARWGDTPVFFYGFDDLTALERDAVETLAMIVGAPVTVSLTYEAGRYALAARARVAEDLRAVAAAVRVLPPVDEHYEPQSQPVLHHLERHLFEPGAAAVDPGETVGLLEAGGERAEAELVAAEVLAARRSGVPAEEIVVVCRSLARSGALFQRALERYGVIARSGRQVPLAHTCLGRALLALGRCALLPNASAADLLAYLRAPGVLADPALVDRLEAELRRRGLSSLAQALSLPETPELPELAVLGSAADPAGELARQARRLLAAAHLRSAARLDVAAALDARAAGAMLTAVAELHELEGEAPAGAELLELLSGLTVPADGTGAIGGVLVAEPAAIRARRFRRVFVTGLCEGEFPAPASAEPFLGEERRRELALASGLVLAPEEDVLARERYLFYACVSRATERLVLSYRSSDEEGNLVLPSPFLADVAELLTPDWWTGRGKRLLADVVWRPESAPTVRERDLGLAAAGVTGLPAAGPAATRHLGAAALAHVRHLRVLSGGALESFASCPVKWLVESQLQPQELEPDGEALVRGSFMHDVLERVIGSLDGPLTPGSLPAAEARLDELVADPPPSLAAGRPPAVRRAVLRGIEADLRRYLRHEADDECDFVPDSVELRFGFDDDEEGSLPGLPGLRLGEGEEAVLVRGMIDRVDVAPAGAGAGAARAIVRDYKSGANRPERAGGRWRDEHQFQVALYMLAVRRLLALQPVAGFFQPLTGRDLRPRGVFQKGAAVGRCAFNTDCLEPEDLEELLADIEAQAVEVASVLRRGELTPCPETCSRDGCRHPGICWA